MADIKIIVDSNDAIKATKNFDTLDESVSNLGRTSQTSGKSVDKAIRGVNQFGSVAKNGGKKLNTFNMQIQQGGYQLQDFVVQLQGGTSVFTAFGQQGSQFAGVFGPQGAVIGAVIAIGSAVGGMAYKMLTAANEIKDFKDAMEETSSALENLSAATDLAAMSTKELQESFGGASGAMKGALEILRDLSKNEAQEKIDGLSKSLASLYKTSGDGDRRVDISKLFDVNIFLAFTKAGRKARKVARGLTAEFVNAQTALLEGEGNIDAQIKATERLLAVTQTLADASGGRSKEEEALIKKFTLSLVEMVKIKSVQEGISQQTKISNELEKNRLKSLKLYYANLEKITKLQKDRAEAVKKIRDAVDAEKKSMGDTIALNELILTHGKDSLQVKVEEAKQARDKYELDQNSKKILGDNLIDVMKLYDINVGLVEQNRINAELDKGRLASVKTFLKYQTDIAKTQAERKAGVDAIKKAVEGETKRLTDQTKLNQEILDHGEDSLEVRTLEAKQARDKYELDQKSKKILGDNLKDVMKLYDINVALTDQHSKRQRRQVEYQKTINGLLAQNQVFVNSLNEAAVIARDKAAEQLEHITNLEEKYGESVVTALALAGVDITSPISSAADEAARLAKELGVALEVSAAVLLEQRSLEQTKNPAVMYKYGGRSTTDSRKPTMDGKTLPKTKKTKGGGGNVIDINKIIEARKLQIQQDRVLIGLSGEQQEAQRIYYELLKENEKADVQVTETKLKNSADYIAAKLKENRVLEEAKAQQQQIADTIESSMEDAFMSIVDGTKSTEDAFKDMARMIIKELYKVLVVQQLVGSFEAGGGGILGSIFGAFEADGGAWQGGSKIQAYANGGVVGSPTTFPMAGGKTGLMGEAGPEAIMPLKRGANGKLGVQMEGGGGDNVVIHQNFNFQANGDESVKKLIAQAAPQIANMTKSSMLNDRRRGGATKAVFG